METLHLPHQVVDLREHALRRPRLRLLHRVLVGTLEDHALERDVGVQAGHPGVRVPEELLHMPKLCATIEKVRRARACGRRP